MSLRFLYTTDYVDYNPPLEWGSLSTQLKNTGSSENLNATISTDVFENTLNINTLTFTGRIANYIEYTHIPDWGVSNGVNLRIENTEPTGENIIIFDGYIDLSTYSKKTEKPLVFTANIIDFNDNADVVDTLSVMTQGFVESLGDLNSSHYINIPTVKESKKNLPERAILLTQFALDVSNFFYNAIQNFLSAISDIAGFSAPIGVVELLLYLINTVTEVVRLNQAGQTHKDLLFPEIRYYKGVNLKGLIEAGFASVGKSVEFGFAENLLKDVYLMSAPKGFEGYAFQTPFGTGRLKSGEPGYIYDELLGIVQKMINGKIDVRGDTVHFRNKYDPFWSESPLYTAPNVLREQNRNNEDFSIENKPFPATWFFEFAIDRSDTHTLTEKTKEYYEIRRKLINEIDPKVNTLKGIENIEIPYALGVRKRPLDNLYDILVSISENAAEFLDQLQGFVTIYLDQISSAELSEDPSELIADIFALSSFFPLLSDREGVLKIDDDAFETPKILYMKEQSVGYRIPANFKDFLGGKAIYSDFYKKGSPADVNNFEGQRRIYSDWRIPFNGKNYNEIVENPNFILDGSNAEFTDIDYQMNGREAVVTLEKQEVYDTNITEVEITNPEE